MARVGQHGPVTDHKNPVDQAVEYVVYAPLGFALEARRLLPVFVDRGRQQVQMAKMIGQFAVTKGQQEALSRLADAQVQAESVLSEFGLRPGSGATATSAPGGAPDTAAPAAPAPAPVAPVRSSAAAAELAIADYDSLAASQVIPRLEGLGAAELDAVRRYEAEHRGRKTILGKVTQLQGE